jgi:hypothetical protein
MTLNEIVDVAMQIESEDPIEWEYLNVNEEDAYKLIGLSVLEMYKEWETSTNKDLIIASTITKLMVENFALNLKLQVQRRLNE